MEAVLAPERSNGKLSYTRLLHVEPIKPEHAPAEFEGGWREFFSEATMSCWQTLHNISLAIVWPIRIDPHRTRCVVDLVWLIACSMYGVMHKSEA
eukprot:481506-Amphidinium_carterae.1